MSFHFSFTDSSAVGQRCATGPTRDFISPRIRSTVLTGALALAFYPEREILGVDIQVELEIVRIAPESQTPRSVHVAGSFRSTNGERNHSTRPYLDRRVVDVGALLEELLVLPRSTIQRSNSYTVGFQVLSWRRRIYVNSTSFRLFENTGQDSFGRPFRTEAVLGPHLQKSWQDVSEASFREGDH